VAVVGLGLPRGALSQELRLDAPEAAFPDGFGMIQTVRELADGRVVVADPLGMELAVLDLDAGTRVEVGRRGRGPGEYRQPDAVWALPDGSTLLVDLGNGRLTVLDSGFEYASSMPLILGDPSSSTYVVGLPEGVDGAGRLYVEDKPLFGGAPQDSAAVIRVGGGGAEMDTIVRVGLPGSETRQGSSGGRSLATRSLPLSSEDAWGVAPDGSVAVARARDYHLEWIRPDGRIVAGPPVPHDRHPIRRAEKEEWALELQRAGGGLNSNYNTSNGVTEVTLTRAAAFGGRLDVDRIAFPDRKPAFYADRILVDGLGRAWVRRHMPAGEPPTYDVFDGRGERVRVVELPADRRLVGFGAGSLYAVRYDEFDLTYVERYALPDDS
jgi:hypothetical protein